MAYIKYQAGGLFTGKALLEEAQVLVVSETGKVEAIVPAADAGEGVQRVEGILCPGFINCHCHLELSHLKGLLPEKQGLVRFVTGVLEQRHFAEPVMAAAMADAEAAMLEQGIVAVGDICNTAHTVPQKRRQRMRYHNFIEVSGFVPAGAATRLQQAAMVQQQFAAEGLLPAVITPHAPYSVSPALFRMINERAAGNLLSLHSQETPEEQAFFVSGNSHFRQLYAQLGVDISFYHPPGKSSLQASLPLLDQAGSLLLVHNTCTQEEDLLFAAATAGGPQLYWCLCIQANLYIENTLPPVDLLRRHGCALVMGTDSLASNHGLSILDELKTLHLHFPAIPLAELLQWATLNGAKALQLDHVLGSFEKGKQPGILCIGGIQHHEWAGAWVKRLL